MIEQNEIIAGRYRVEQMLGQGGMGAVYLAVDGRFGNHVALKATVVDHERDDLRRAFRREAELLNKLKHSALPKVTDFFEYGDAEFLVMEFVSGRDLAEVLRENGKPFPTRQVLEWADKLLDALNYLHTRRPSVIHRDIKPENMKLTPEGEIVLLDFGLAKRCATSQMMTTSVLGWTPHFAPLEQMNGEGSDVRSDLYSLAATLYALLTYQVPADACVRGWALVNDMADPLMPAHLVNPAVPVPVSLAIHAAMSLRRDLRPESAAAMRRALREAGTPTMPFDTGSFGTPESSVDRVAAASLERTQVSPPSLAPGRRRAPLALGAAAMMVLASALVAGSSVSKLASDSAPVPAPEPDVVAVEPAPAAPVAAAPVAVEVLRIRFETPGGGKPGWPDRMDVMRQFRLRFSVPAEGRLYVAVIDPSGDYKTFLSDRPSGETDMTTNTIAARRDYVFPSRPLSMRLKKTGDRLVVVFAAPGAAVPMCFRSEVQRSLSPAEVQELSSLVVSSRASIRMATEGDRGQWMVVTRTEGAGDGIVAFELP